MATALQDRQTIRRCRSSLLSVDIVYGDDRDAATDRMCAALASVEINGIATNAAFLVSCMEHSEFRARNNATDFVRRNHTTLPE